MIANSLIAPGFAVAVPPFANDSARAMQAIAAEVADYSERLLSDGAATVAQMATATSMTDAFQIIAAFQKRTLEETAQQSSRLLSLYSAAVQIQTRALETMLMPTFR
jgi:hypothetical protein